ncbi:MULTISPECIES: alpha/beta hydrolase [Thermomonospora]|uniref:Putative esterase n=1 Tax=Thermomonospora curvata (strain ATCC 19995 / DSM 43183 / JCM 3096 / KCTC 9072 / NBRC 15933 / NCIMB 10081 / Henssen B9) TaxID=471852 RepID=D1A9A3_THECD|nr:MULTISPECIES: alpha/beta hydrolase family protein [Thermomonospora]ACY96799.1 putative esterase [Thermomonospora curvata DSM 43183]PKK15338.1 MAG: esterase [Thermomonospora sp. CIF 1]
MAITRRPPVPLLGERRLSSRLYELDVASAAVGRTMKVHLLVPKGWSRDADRTWPLLYLFHGGDDDYLSWTRETDIEQLSADCQVLVAIPDGGRAGGYTNWWNFGRPGAPQWETFHLDELGGLLREAYRAGDAQAMAGVSGGGYGALIYAARRPGTFRYAAAFSSPCSIRRPALAATLLLATASVGRTNPLAMWGLPVIHDRIWRSFDPICMAAGLRGTGLYLSAGTGRRGPLDPPDARRTVADLAEPLVRSTVGPFLRKLRKLDIPVTTHLYDRGTHTWPYWRRELHRAWPLIMQALGCD